MTKEKETLEYFQGTFELPGMEPLRIEFACKPGASQVEVDAAYLAALAQQAEINYLSVKEAVDEWLPGTSRWLKNHGLRP